VMCVCVCVLEGGLALCPDANARGTCPRLLLRAHVYVHGRTTGAAQHHPGHRGRCSCRGAACRLPAPRVPLRRWQGCSKAGIHGRPDTRGRQVRQRMPATWCGAASGVQLWLALAPETTTTSTHTALALAPASANAFASSAACKRVRSHARRC
jgi:hypothetical protein